MVIERKPSIRIGNSSSAADTLALMRMMVRRYRRDLLPYATMRPDEFFELLSARPWREDRFGGEAIEVLKRPKLTLHMAGPGGDCDDKSIAMASLFSVQGTPWRFVAVARQKGQAPSHVYVEADLGYGWTPFDATYPHNAVGVQMRDYEVKVYG